MRLACSERVCENRLPQPPRFVRRLARSASKRGRSHVNCRRWFGSEGVGSMDAHSVLLLDEYGQPLSTRLQDVLLPLAARLRRQFPSLNDDCTLTEVLEESGRRIA